MCPNIYMLFTKLNDISSKFIDMNVSHNKNTCRTRHLHIIQSLKQIDWCCFYYFVRNCLVALLEALCARIFFFGFVNIGFFWYFICVCKVSNIAFLSPLSTRLLFTCRVRTNYMSFKLFEYYYMSFNINRHINTRLIFRCGVAVRMNKQTNKPLRTDQRPWPYSCFSVHPPPF